MWGGSKVFGNSTVPVVEHYLEQRGHFHLSTGCRWTSTVKQKKLAFNTEKKTVSACKDMHSNRVGTVKLSDPCAFLSCPVAQFVELVSGGSLQYLCHLL